MGGLALVTCSPVLVGFELAVLNSEFKVLLAVGGNICVIVLKLHGFKVSDEACGFGATAVVVFMAGVVHALDRERGTFIL